MPNTVDVLHGSIHSTDVCKQERPHNSEATDFTSAVS
jgi:hypothetical protein